MEKIIELMNKYSEIVKVLGPVTEDDIMSAENELGVKLPKKYRDYIELYGAGCVLGFALMGVNPWYCMSISESAEIWRELGVDKKYVPIYDIGEFAYFLDSTLEDGPVYVVYHGTDFKPRICDKNFNEFMVSQIMNRVDDSGLY